MSRFFSSRFSELKPYVPGIQPSDPTGFTKLNTNESPFPVSEKALEYAAKNARPSNLYCDTDAKELCALFAKTVGVGTDEVIAGNGSDEILNFAFMAFCGEGCPAVFPDITYGFYPVFAALNGIEQVIIPLADDLSIKTDEYLGVNGTLFIANPNAPTGIALPPAEIEKLAAAKPGFKETLDFAVAGDGETSRQVYVATLLPALKELVRSEAASLCEERLAGMAPSPLSAPVNYDEMTDREYYALKMR